MKRIIAASQNEHKIKEIEAITKEFGMEIISRHDAGIADIDIEEDGVTFEENSYKKAYEIMKLSGEITIADDSGIVVDCLGDAPGVYSTRYAGFDGNDEANNKKLRESIKGVPFEKCTARFVSVITIVYPDGDTIVARGEIEGHVIPEERGSNGFGYDPLFIPLGYDRTFGEFDLDDKNAISHRSRALKSLKKQLEMRKMHENKDNEKKHFPDL